MIELLAFGPGGWGDEMLLGAGVTVLLALCAYALGVTIGLFGALGKLSASRPLRAAMEVYTTVFRGVPELLVIYLFAFGTPQLLLAIGGLFGYSGFIQFPAFAVGLLAVGIVSGAYSTEVFRGAMQVVPEGQIEAGLAIGMSPGQVFRRIRLPQTLRLALPGLGNVWQLTLKDTALVSVAGLAETMRYANIAAGSSREPFAFYVVAALIYLVLTTVSQAMFQRAEHVTGRGWKRA